MPRKQNRVPARVAGRIGFDPRSLLFWPALPLIALQGMWLQRGAYRAAEASGERFGAVGDGPPFHLLALGDSITVGVGLSDLQQALPAQFAASIAARLARRVSWQTGGRNGATTRGLRHQLDACGEAVRGADLLLVSIGVNDATGLRSRAAIAADLDAALGALRLIRPRLSVVLAGLPPLNAFPALPPPLRQLLGLRSRQIDAVLAQLAVRHRGVRHVPMSLAPRPEQFSADGFHPNAAACAAWAVALSEALPDDVLA